jgi:hypothetical protein
LILKIFHTRLQNHPAEKGFLDSTARNEPLDEMIMAEVLEIKK